MNCSEVFRKIDELNEEYVRMWEEFCNIESPTAYKEGVDNACSFVIEKAKARGWKVETKRMEIAGDPVMITMNADAGSAPIALSGHADTVHPVGSFGTPAVTIDREADEIHGPGVGDCKGGIVAAFMAMAALDDLGFDKRPVMLLIQTDEECSSLPSKGESIRWICEKAQNAVAFFNAEPYSGVTMERKGILKYVVKISGKECHASSCYTGASAIREAAYKIVEIEKWKEPEGITANCGVIKGGSADNTVPAFCEFTVDFRFSNAEEEKTIRDFMENIAKTPAVEGTSCEAYVKSRRPSMPFSQKNLDLMNRLNEIFTREGLKTYKYGKSRGGSDAAQITEYGIPCADSVGVQSKFIHMQNEYARISSLSESAKHVAAAILEL